MKTAPLRAAARIAWRTARRNVRRSVLILAMVALPVALTTATATVARTIVASPEEAVAGVMGSGDLLLTVANGRDVERVERGLPPRSEVVVMRVSDVQLVERGQLAFATIVEPDEGLETRLLRGLYELESGRAPETAGEAALNERLLQSLGAQVGDEVRVGDLRVTVTGVAAAQDLDHALAVLGAGTLRGRPQFINMLIDLPRGTPTQSVVDRVPNHGFNTREEVAAFARRDAATWDAVSLVGGVLALFATGLIAAAAFVVGARRQLRQLGLLGAVGGEPRHVRAVVWLGGTTLGLLGGVVGSVIGLGLAVAVHPFLDRAVGRDVGLLHINPLILVVAILMGAAAATIAALAPARVAAKLSVMAALGGITPPPRQPGRVAAFGLLVLVLGALVTAWATIRMEDDILAFGLVAMITGVLLGIPLLVTGVGKIANALPATARLAARDAARHGRKTGAAVAAGVIALAVPVAVSAYSLSEEAYERKYPRLLENELLIGTYSEVAPHGMPDEVAAEFEEVFPRASVVPLAQAVPSGAVRIDRGPVYAQVVAAGELGGESSAGSETVVAWPLFVGDGEMLRALDAEQGIQALREGRAVVLGGYEPKNRSVAIDTPRGGREKVPAIALDSPGYLNEAIPKVVIPRATADRLGLDEMVLHHLLTNPTPLSQEEIARSREIAARHEGVFVNSNDDYLPPYAAARAAVTAASLPLALSILAVAVALVACESRRSHQILVAVGAGPLAHRKVVGATAALLATITAILAVPAGFLPTAVVQMANQSGRPVVVPWMTIAILVTLVPILSALVAAIAARIPKLGSLLTPAT